MSIVLCTQEKAPRVSTRRLLRAGYPARFLLLVSLYASLSGGVYYTVLIDKKND